MKLDLSKETLLPWSACCECGKRVDAVSGPCVPAPGDMTLCAYCGCLNVFNGKLELRAPTDDEIFQVATSKEFQAVRRAIHAVNAPKEKSA